jgi:hypothetical protein
VQPLLLHDRLDCAMPQRNPLVRTAIGRRRSHHDFTEDIAMAAFRSAFLFFAAIAVSLGLGGGAGYLLHPNPAGDQVRPVYVYSDSVYDGQTCVFLPGPHHKAC